jgi:hypothetical protein
MPDDFFKKLPKPKFGKINFGLCLFFTMQTKLKNMSEKEFQEEVLAAPLAGNVDEPEGGLDALMQVTNVY